MIPSLFPLTISYLALSCSAFKLPSRSPHGRRDAEPIQNFDNLVLTNADQNLFFSPTGFGSLEIAGILSTAHGDILLPSGYADKLEGFTDQGRSTATGNITSGPVSLAGWSVPDQDIVLYATEPGENPDTAWPLGPQGAFAYFGLGTNPQSTVYSQLDDWSGATFIARVAATSPENRYYTLLLQPDITDLGTDQVLGGVISINEIADLITIFNLTASQLQSVPNLTDIKTYPLLQYNGKAEIIIEGLVGPNGPITLTTNSAVPAGSTTAYIDSTQPSILVNADVARNIYGSIPGAQLVDGRWCVPCTELSATWTIAGHQYPMSPLTMVSPAHDSPCVGTFQPKADETSGDIVLGVPFLKNVYALFGYTTWEATGISGVVSDPYIQLMPVTDPSTTHDEWVNAGWGSGNTTDSDSKSTPDASGSGSIPTSSLNDKLSTTATGSTPAVSDGGTDSVSGLLADSDATSDNQVFLGNNVQDWIYHCLPAFVVGAAFLALILIAVGIWVCVRRKQGPGGKGAYKNVHEGVAASTVHLPLYGTEGHSKYTDPYED